MAVPAFPYIIERIRKLDGASTERLKVMLAAAYKDDPYTAIATDHDEAFYGDVHCPTIFAGLLGGEVYVAKSTSEKDKDKIVGVIVWYPPGRELFDTEEQRREGLSILWESDDSKTWWNENFLPSYSKFARNAFGEGTKLNSWHLQSLAVHPDHQRKGIARTFVNMMKPRAAEVNAPMCVETGTELNVTIYQKLGFEVKGRTTITKGEESFPVVCLQQDVQDF